MPVNSFDFASAPAQRHSVLPQFSPTVSDLARQSTFSKIARKLCSSPAMICAVLASSGLCTVPALLARRQQALTMSLVEMSHYLPSRSTFISNLSGVMIHNAGSDIARSDTLFLLSNQHESTVKILESTPAIGAQMDPYKKDGRWFIRHAIGDGSASLELKAELDEVNAWLDKNPERIFVLDLDTYQRLARQDSSLAELVKSSFGDKLLQREDELVLNDPEGFRRFGLALGAAIDQHKQVFLTERSASIPGFRESVDPAVTVQPWRAHAADLTPVYALGRGIGPVDNMAFEGTRGMVRDHLETPQEIAAHVAQPNTQIILDQVNRASFVEPLGFESDPVFMSVYPDSELSRNASLASTVGAAFVGAFAALAAAGLAMNSMRNSGSLAGQASPWLKGLSGVQLTSAISNSALTLATTFPGLRSQLGIGGVVVGLAGLALTVKAFVKNRQAVVTHVPAAPPSLSPEFVQNEPQSPLIARSAMAQLSHVATAYHVLTRFTSLAKYQIPLILPTLGALNVVLSVIHTGMKAGLENTRSPLRPSMKKEIRREALRSGMALAGMLGSLGVVMPQVSGRFALAALAAPAASMIGAKWLTSMRNARS